MPRDESRDALTLPRGKFTYRIFVDPHPTIPLFLENMGIAATLVIQLANPWSVNYFVAYQVDDTGAFFCRSDLEPTGTKATLGWLADGLFLQIAPTIPQ